MQVSAPCSNMDYMTTTHQGQVPCIPKGLLNEFDSILGGVWDDLINMNKQFLDMTCVDYLTGSCQWHCKADAVLYEHVSWVVVQEQRGMACIQGVHDEVGMGNF